MSQLSTQAPARPAYAHNITRVSLARVGGAHLSAAANEPQPQQVPRAGTPCHGGDKGRP